MSAVAQERKIEAESPRDDPEINLDQDAFEGDFGDEESPGCIEKILEKPWLLITIGVATLVALFILLWACGVFSFTEKKPDAPPGNRKGATRAHKNNSGGPLKEVDTTNASPPAKNQDQSWKYAVCAVPFLIGCGVLYNSTGSSANDAPLGEKVDELESGANPKTSLKDELDNNCEGESKWECARDAYDNHCNKSSGKPDDFCTELHDKMTEHERKSTETFRGRVKSGLMLCGVGLTFWNFPILQKGLQNLWYGLKKCGSKIFCCGKKKKGSSNANGKKKGHRNKKASNANGKKNRRRNKNSKSKRASPRNKRSAVTARAPPSRDESDSQTSRGPDREHHQRFDNNSFEGRRPGPMNSRASRTGKPIQDAAAASQVPRRTQGRPAQASRLGSRPHFKSETLKNGEIKWTQVTKDGKTV